MSEQRVLYALAAFTSSRPMLPAMIETLKRKIPIDVVFYDIVESSKHKQTILDGIDYLRGLGFNVFTETPRNMSYDIVYSTYPYYYYDEVTASNQVKYHVKFNYFVAGANVHQVHSRQSVFNYYDFIVCLGEPDPSIYSAHAKSVNIGNIKLADYKRNRQSAGNDQKTILWLPTWGTPETSLKVSSINADVVHKLIELQDKYNILVKMHPFTSHLESQQEHFKLLSAFNCLDPDMTTEKLFNQADICLSDRTSGAFDSIAADVPLALYGLGEPYYFGGKLCLHQQLVEDGIVPGTNNVDELESVIERALTPECFMKQQKLKKEMYPYEGRECVEAFMRFQDDLLHDRVDPWYIASRRAIRENYIEEQKHINGQMEFASNVVQITQATVQSYENSMSWKITKPLRAAKNIINKLKK